MSATDPDGGSVTYSIEGGNAAGLFEIDAASGELFYVGAGEDYDTGTTSFNLTVRASDGDQTTDTSVTVNVTDVDEPVEDNPPVVQPDQSTAQTVSEPAGEDFARNSSTSGRVAVGDTATGRIGSSGDRDWFAVELVAGRTYVIDLRGSPTGDGTLSDPYLRGIYDADGDRISNTTDDDGGQSYNSRVTLTATESGTHYIAAGAYSSRQGTYELEVTDTSPPETPPEQVQQQPPAFGSQFYTFDLAEDTEGSANRISLGAVSATDPDGGSVSYSIEGGNAAGLFELDAASGELFYVGGGEDYETGSTRFELTVRASDGDQTTDTSVTVNVTDVAEAPAFAQAGYAFDLAEDTNGSVARLSLGTVSATDPDGGSVTYSIEGGNAAGLFEIDAASGELFYVGAGEDYDTGTTSFNLTVRASDGDETTDATVTVNVTDVDEPVEVDPLVTEPDQNTPQTVSEPAGEDFSANTSTSGRVTVGSSAIGEIENAGDQDWFAVELEAGKTYQIDMSGEPTGGGTLPRGNLHGVYDAEGNRIPGVFDPATSWIIVNHQSVRQDDDQVFFTPEEDGTYYVAASNGGTTDTGTYTVRVTEMEDDFPETVDTTGTVEVGGSATGEIEYQTDSDWFAVELVAGQTYTIDLKGSPTSDGTLRDPKLRGIHDAEGNRIPDTLDFDGGTGRNSRLTFTATESGTYYIAASAHSMGVGTYEVEVWEDDFAASRNTTGTVEVGGATTGEIQRADDLDYVAVELEAGKTYQIDMSGAYTGGGTMTWPHLLAVYDADGISTGVRDAVIIVPTFTYDGGGNLVEIFSGEDEQAFFTPEEDGTYYLVVGNFHSNSTGTYTVRVTEIEDDFPATVDTTGTVEVGGSATGELQYETDRDWFAVELTAGETYKIELLGARGEGGTLRDPYIRGIHDADGRLIDDTTDYSSGPYSNSEVLFTPNEDGTYYIAAGSYMTGYREEDVGTYTLQVSNDDFRGDTDTTGTVDVGGSVTGEIEAQGDEDWFAVTLEAGRTYQIDLEGSATHAGTLENPFLRTMRDADGNYLELASGIQNIFTADRDSGEGLNSRVTFTPDENGTYYLVAASGGPVGSADSHGRSLGTYTLSVTDTSPLETSQEQVQQQPVEVDPPVAQTVSEPAGQDFARNSSTSGRVAVGDTATGRIGSSGDRDWFAVELVAGRTYVIDLRGSPTGDGTLSDPYLRGIYDADGNRISNTTDDDGGQSYNSRVTGNRERHPLHRGGSLFQPPGHVRAGGDGHLPARDTAGTGSAAASGIRLSVLRLRA